MYRSVAYVFGAAASEGPDPGLTADVDAMIEAITPRTKLIYIANPNNPTGTMVGAAELDRLVKNVPSNVGIVLDEAYYEFLPNPPDTLRYVHETRNVILLRTFSKIQVLASLCIGYGLSN